MACNSCKKKNADSGKSKSVITSNSNFAFRSNLENAIISNSQGEKITNSNLTDELAIEFLRENPNRITMFEKFPANWKDLLSDKTDSGQEEK